MEKCLMRSGTTEFNLSQYSKLETCSLPQYASPASVAVPKVLWKYPSAALTLARNEIHLWRVRLDQALADVDPFNAMLSEDESGRAARYHFERDRRRFTLRRALLREILSRYLDTEPAGLRFAYGPCGKPALAFPRDDNLHFNLSHSDGLALYAVTREGAIGVDIERVRVIREAGQIAARFFSPQEVAEWRSLPGDQRPEWFLRHWSRKEAGLKMSGQGLFDATAPALSQREGAERNGATSWPQCSGLGRAGVRVLYELTPAPEYVGALALAAPGVVRG